jgi:hypothetical protein
MILPQTVRFSDKTVGIVYIIVFIDLFDIFYLLVIAAFYVLTYLACFMLIQ